MGHRTNEYARSRLSGPAIGLIATCILSSVVLLLSRSFSLFLIFSGTAAEMAQPQGMSKETQISIRAGWNVLMLVAHAVILVGALRMRACQSRGLTITACILAAVPCLGPCFVLGMPFGVWGLVALNDPKVQRAFRR